MTATIAQYRWCGEDIDDEGVVTQEIGEWTRNREHAAEAGRREFEAQADAATPYDRMRLQTRTVTYSDITFEDLTPRAKRNSDA